MLVGCDYALATTIVILNFKLTVSAPRIATDSSNWAQKSQATNGGMDKWSVHDRVAAEGGVGCERTDGVTLGVIRSRHPSVVGGRNRHTSPSALEDSSLILQCQLSHSALSSTSAVICQTAQ